MMAELDLVLSVEGACRESGQAGIAVSSVHQCLEIMVVL